MHPLSLGVLATVALTKGGHGDLVHDLPSRCELHQPMRVATKLREIPEVFAEFQRIGWPIIDGADVGSSQKAPAASIDEPALLLRAYVSRQHIVVWFLKRGGFVNVFHVVGLEPHVDARGLRSMRIAPHQHLGGDNPCAATQALIDGVRTLD